MPVWKLRVIVGCSDRMCKAQAGDFAAAADVELRARMRVRAQVDGMRIVAAELLGQHLEY